MTDTPPPPHYHLHEDIVFARAPRDGLPEPLQCDLYLPATPAARPPLLVWFHDGAFRVGSHQSKMCRRLGRRLTGAGIAVASVQYRLHSKRGDLSDPVSGRYDALQRETGPWLRRGLSHFRALAAMEDGIAFLNWARENGDRFGWSDRFVLGGSSAGGITALNLTFTAPHIGLDRPHISSLVLTSAGYNYPALIAKAPGCPILALHDPDDRRVPIDSVRALRDRFGDLVELHESSDMRHGGLTLRTGESRAETHARISAFILRTTAPQTAAPG